MLSHLKFGRVVLTVALAASACLFPLNVFADSLPSGERTLGNATIEPAYNDANGSIVYLLTPNRLAPLGASNPINTVDSNAVAPLYLVVYPPGTGGTFNCKGVPGNCPDHDTVVADVVTSTPPILRPYLGTTTWSVSLTPAISMCRGTSTSRCSRPARRSCTSRP